MALESIESFSIPPWNRFFGSSRVSEGSWERVMQECLRPVVVLYIPMILAWYGLTVLLLKRQTTWRGLKLQKLAGSLSMYPAFIVLIYTSHATMLDHRFWTVAYDQRLHKSAYECDVFANFYIATNVVQAIGQLQTEKPPLLYQLMAHHVLSVTCYAAGFYFDRFRWWTAFAGCCEITNLFLVPAFACKEYFPEWRRQTWYLWNSRLLWSTFITHRLVLFPCWLGLWIWDRWRAAATSLDEEDIHWVEGVIYPSTVLGVLILSVTWFRAIDRGLKKQRVVYMQAKKD
jgi:hypothetical protein